MAIEGTNYWGISFEEAAEKYGNSPVDSNDFPLDLTRTEICAGDPEAPYVEIHLDGKLTPGILYANQDVGIAVVCQVKTDPRTGVQTAYPNTAELFKGLVQITFDVKSAIDNKDHHGPILLPANDTMQLKDNDPIADALR